MSFIPIPDTAQVMLNFVTNLATVAQNRFYVQHDGGLGVSVLTNAAENFAEWFDENYSLGVANTWNLANITVRDMSEEFGDEVVFVTGLPISGQATSTQDAFSVSGTATWLTGTVGRSFRGRTYLVGVSGVNVVGNHLHPDFVAGMQTNFESLLTLLPGADFTLGVVSLVSAGVPRSEGLFTPVQSVRVNSPVATQRRRLN